MSSPLDKQSIMREILSVKYLLNALLISIYNMNDRNAKSFNIINNDIARILGRVISDDNTGKSKLTRRKVASNKTNIDEAKYIQFEKFKIKDSQYRALVNEYDIDIVTEACVELDLYLKTSGKKINNVYAKLKNWAIHIALKKKYCTIHNDIMKSSKEFNVEMIDNKNDAIKYIASVPTHMRNLNKEVRFLVEKFGLN